MTPLEVEDYLDAAEQLGYLLMFLLALTAGLRQRELIALQWSDLDEERCTLTIDEGRSVVNGTLVEYSSDIILCELMPHTGFFLCTDSDQFSLWSV